MQQDLLAVMLSWAVTLTGYPSPPHVPSVELVPHQYLVDRACSGQACKVLGWFPPGQTIYLDQRLAPLDGTYSSAVLLHELVHYLQQESRRYPSPYSCDDTIEMEHEAYGVQREYFLRYGVYQPVGLSMHAVGCTAASRE